ncbi:hypothetical protein AOX56_00220 [Aeromonas sobria]|uniref:Uncharacterized protein n=2 Tax=Aeromonas sobria TaxID=646 RepID=A0A2N3J8T3_AERSO|nr:hypothetical protein AOX56_00220 [Aeromonas sobria]
MTLMHDDESVNSLINIGDAFVQTIIGVENTTIPCVAVDFDINTLSEITEDRFETKDIDSLFKFFHKELLNNLNKVGGFIGE